MKPITEEQRQALITDCNEQIKILKNLIFNGSYDEDNSNLESQLLVQEIALASLTADVFMHGISDPDGKAYFSEYCVDDDGSGISDEVCALNDGETDFPGGYSVVPLYTAPPVPMIDLPKYKSKITADCTADVYFQGKGDGWNECLAEIKRLNSLGE